MEFEFWRIVILWLIRGILQENIQPLMSAWLFGFIFLFFKTTELRQPKNFLYTNIWDFEKPIQDIFIQPFLRKRNIKISVFQKSTFTYRVKSFFWEDNIYTKLFKNLKIQIFFSKHDIFAMIGSVLFQLCWKKQNLPKRQFQNCQLSDSEHLVFSFCLFFCCFISLLAGVLVSNLLILY